MINDIMQSMIIPRDTTTLHAEHGREGVVVHLRHLRVRIVCRVVVARAQAFAVCSDASLRQTAAA